eukprot:1066235_1
MDLNIISCGSDIISSISRSQSHIPCIAMNPENEDEKQEHAMKFDEYLVEYREQHHNKYIAPHVIRRLQSEFDHSTNGRCNKSFCTECRKQQQHQLDIERNSSGTQQHATGDSEEELFLHDFLSKHSKYYGPWLSMRQKGWSNQHLEQFYVNKHKNQGKVSRSSDTNIVSLFRRFYRYAIDIDNVCGYKQDLVDNLLLNKKDSVWFLDIGFAPGGMSRYLLDAHAKISGVGITLPQYESGNAFIKELLSNKRFVCREHNIVDLAAKITTRSDFLARCINSSFDLVIVGITCHQYFERLHHRILLSELYLTFLTLNQGGSVLIRHKIDLECIHQHVLYIFFACFSEYQVGKPLTEFAKNKTFWILWKGFDKNKCAELKLVHNIRNLIHEYNGDTPPYGKNPKTKQCYNPKMIDKTAQQIVNQMKDEFVAVLDPVFEIQTKSLRAFCNGKKDRLCHFGKDCKRSRNDCNRAHSKEECIDGFYEAKMSVNKVVFKQILVNKRHSWILQKLEQTLIRTNKKYKRGILNRNSAQ